MKKEERIEEQGPRIKNDEASPSTLAPVPPDRFSPAHEMCPGELIPAAPSSDAENQRSEVKNQREQLSKAGTTRKVAEELHKNEEERSKNEEKGTMKNFLAVWRS